MTQLKIRVKICGIRNLDDALFAAEAGADFIGLVFVPGRHRRLDPSAAKVIVSGLKDAGAAPQVVGLFADQDLEEVNRTIEVCGLDLAQLCGQESLDYCTQTRAKVIKVVHIAEPVRRSGYPSTSSGRTGPAGGENVPPGGENVSPGGEPVFVRDEPVSVRDEPVSVRGEPVSVRGEPVSVRGEPVEPPAIEATIPELVRRVDAYREAGHLVTLDRLVEGLQGGTGESFDWSIAAQLSRQGSSFLLAGGLAPDNVGQAVATVRPWGVDVSSGVETNGDKDHEKIRRFIYNARQRSAVSDQHFAST